jgi:hypothetical protein
MPVEVRFSMPVETGYEAHLASGTVGAVSFPGVKHLGHGADHPLPSSTKVVNRLELYYHLPSVLP